MWHFYSLRFTCVLCTFDFCFYILILFHWSILPFLEPSLSLTFFTTYLVSLPLLQPSLSLYHFYNLPCLYLFYNLCLSTFSRTYFVSLPFLQPILSHYLFYNLLCLSTISTTYFVSLPFLQPTLSLYLFYNLPCLYPFPNLSCFSTVSTSYIISFYSTLSQYDLFCAETLSPFTSPISPASYCPSFMLLACLINLLWILTTYHFKDIMVGNFTDF